MGSNPISRTKKEKSPILGGFFLPLCSHKHRKLTININKTAVYGRNLPQNCARAAHRLRTAKKLRTYCARNCARYTSLHSFYTNKKAAHFAAPIISSKKLSIRLSTDSLSLLNVCWYTRFSVWSVDHPPRSWAYRLGIPKAAMMDAFICRS